ncbi:MAG: 16S rRNA (adenine(1518)-N(6)/adenine(1519)-N(6))-dimethyltransferase RsmA [Oscillospiraceae bacterium]|nr:16S rRNA (adenine(1518)-N(6)/adenine(1519)-N(6))-dimethyltransferase RsmA [Oscillospiraceae bacterium]
MNNIDERAVLRRHGFTFSKAMGQNFLINPAVCPRMAALCGANAHTGVLEIGPGAGTLTRELAQVAAKVVAVELDERLLPVLEETLAGLDNVTVVQGDVLQLDLPALLREHFGDMPVVVCANLPYYITSPVVMHLLESRLFTRLTIMVQLEAAQRLCAPMGSRACGAITAAVEFFCSEAKLLFKVSRGSFLPPPNVDSAVLQLVPREEITMDVRVLKLVRAAFGQRRKTAVNAISAGLGLEKSRVVAAMTQAGIAENARAENITLEQYAQLWVELQSRNTP